MAAKPEAKILRERLHQRGSHFAWSWCYSVIRPDDGKEVTIGTHLASTRGWCKDRGWKPVQTWAKA